MAVTGNGPLTGRRRAVALAQHWQRQDAPGIAAVLLELRTAADTIDLVYSLLTEITSLGEATFGADWPDVLGDHCSRLALGEHDHDVPEHGDRP